MLRRMIRLASAILICTLYHRLDASPMRLIGLNFDVTNATGQPANDFHMIFDVPNGFFPHTTVPPFEFYVAPDPFNTIQVNASINKTFTIDWSNPNTPVQNGQTAHFGFLIMSDDSPIYVDDAYWTQNGIQTSVNLPVLSAINSTTEINLANAGPVPDLVQQLQLLNSPTQIPLQNLLPFTLPGFQPPKPDFSLPAGSNMTFDPSFNLSSGYIILQYKVSRLDDPTDQVSVMQEFQIIPEPATGVSLMAGLVVVALLNHGLRRAAHRSNVRLCSGSGAAG